MRRFVVVGHFAFARLIMFKDLDRANWHGGHGIVGSSVVGELLAGQGSPADVTFAGEYDVDSPEIARQVMDAVPRASQEKIMPDIAERPHGLEGTVGGSTYVKPGQMEWKPTRFDKISIKVLYEDTRRAR